jgi:hypothetical protein
VRTALVPVISQDRPRERIISGISTGAYLFIIQQIRNAMIVPAGAISRSLIIFEVVHIRYLTASELVLLSNRITTRVHQLLRHNSPIRNEIRRHKVLVEFTILLDEVKRYSQAGHIILSNFDSFDHRYVYLRFHQGALQV